MSLLHPVNLKPIDDAEALFTPRKRLRPMKDPRRKEPPKEDGDHDQDFHRIAAIWERWGRL